MKQEISDLIRRLSRFFQWIVEDVDAAESRLHGRTITAIPHRAFPATCDPGPPRLQWAAALLSLPWRKTASLTSLTTRG